MRGHRGKTMKEEKTYLLIGEVKKLFAENGWEYKGFVNYDDCEGYFLQYKPSKSNKEFKADDVNRRWVECN